MQRHGALRCILIVETDEQCFQRSRFGCRRRARGVVLLWREVFLLGFGVFNLYFAWVDWKSWGYIVLAVLCTASAVLLWRSSPLSKYPLYAVTALLAGSALVGGVYNYVHNPAVRQGTLEFHIISWLIPGVPSVLLINCCLYARRVARRGRRMGNSQGKS
jgi:hypothetical protein